MKSKLTILLNIINYHIIITILNLSFVNKNEINQIKSFLKDKMAGDQKNNKPK